MDGAEDLGKRLLGEVEECGFDEVRYDPISNSLYAASTHKRTLRSFTFSVYEMRIRMLHTSTFHLWTESYTLYNRQDHTPTARTQ